MISKSLGLFVLLALVCVPSWAERPTRPTHLFQLGMLYPQLAYVLPDAKVAWADYELLREDFPFLRQYDNATIDKILVFNFAVVSDLQYELEDILISKIPDSVRNTFLFHPLTYLRAAVASFHTKEGEHFGVGLMDLKGTGYSPEGEGRLQEMLGMLKLLKGEESHLFDLGEQRISRYRQGLADAEKPLSAMRLRLRNARTADERRRAHHNLHNNEIRVERIRIFIEGMDAIAADPGVRQHWVDRFIHNLRGSDYVNAAFAFDRGVKEAIVERALHTLFQEHNKKHGTNLQTNRTYFVMAMPYDILLPDGGRRQAGIIGRRPGWRELADRSQHESKLPRSIVGSVLDGADQFTAFGDMIDFELPEVRDPRVSAVLGWRDGHGQPIEAMAKVAAEAFSAGDPNAVRKLFDDVLSPLGPVPLHEVRPPLERTDRVSELWERLDPSKPEGLTKAGFIQRMRVLKLRDTSSVVLSAMLAELLKTHPDWVADYLISELEEMKEPYDISVFQPVLFSMFLFSMPSVEQGARVLAAVREKDSNLAFSLVTTLVEGFLRLDMTLEFGTLTGFGNYRQIFTSTVSALVHANAGDMAEGATTFTLNMNVSGDDGEVKEVNIVEGLAQLFRAQGPGRARESLIKALINTVERLSGRDLVPQLKNGLKPWLDLLPPEDCGDTIAAEDKPVLDVLKESGN